MSFLVAIFSLCLDFFRLTLDLFTQKESKGWKKFLVILGWVLFLIAVGLFVYEYFYSGQLEPKVETEQIEQEQEEKTVPKTKNEEIEYPSEFIITLKHESLWDANAQALVEQASSYENFDVDKLFRELFLFYGENFNHEHVRKFAYQVIEDLCLLASPEVKSETIKFLENAKSLDTNNSEQINFIINTLSVMIR